MKVSATILAGGKSRRLGRDKALVEIGGEPLILREIRMLQELSSDIVVVTAADHPLSILDGREGVRLVEDERPGKGALGGILTGLRAAANYYSIVVGCDMPFLSLSLLQYMVESCEGFDVVVPRFEGYLEALHAVYAKSCLPVIERTLDRGELKIVGFFSDVRARYVDEAEIDRFDPRRLSFLNVNTEDDMRRAMEIERGN